jgi:thiol-disulfide isomerase/thioredoxin
MKEWKLFNNWKLRVFVTSFLVVLLIVPVGAFSHLVKFVISFWTYVALFCFFREKFAKNSTFIIAVYLALPVVILYVPIYLFIVTSYIALPSSIAPILGIGFGLILFNFNRIGIVILSILALCGTCWIIVEGYDKWIHRVGYGTYTGEVNEELTTKFYLTDIENNTRDIVSYRGQMIILDFWTTSCAPCYKTFPLFESYYIKHQNNPKIQFLSVNIPIERDTVGEAEKIIRSRGYTFPVLYAANDSAYKSLGVFGVPTVIVIDTNQRIVYRGGLDGIKRLGL